MLNLGTLFGQIRIDGAGKAQSDLAGVVKSTALVSAGFLAAKKAADTLRQGLLKFAELEEASTRVTALTGELDKFGQASVVNVERQILSLAETTRFTSKEVGEAFGFMAQAGLTMAQIVSAAPKTLELAAAALMDVGQAADITTNVLSGMGLEVQDLGRVNDVLIKTASTSNNSVAQLGQAFKFVGPVAKSAGIQIEEVSAALGVLGNSGLQGEMGGTALRGAISKLLSPSKEATKTLQALGISITAADFRKEGGLVSVLQKLGPLANDTGALFKIFGQRAGPGMAVLLSAGADKVGEYVKVLRKAEGTAKALADAQNKTLAGRLRLLESQFDSLSTKIGQVFAPVLEALLPALGELAGGLSEVVANAAEAVRAFSDFSGISISLDDMINGIKAFGLTIVQLFDTLVGAIVKVVTAPVELLLKSIGTVETAIGRMIVGLSKIPGVKGSDVGTAMAGVGAGLAARGRVVKGEGTGLSKELAEALSLEKALNWWGKKNDELSAARTKREADAQYELAKARRADQKAQERVTGMQLDLEEGMIAALTQQNEKRKEGVDLAREEATWLAAVARTFGHIGEDLNAAVAAQREAAGVVQVTAAEYERILRTQRELARLAAAPPPPPPGVGPGAIMLNGPAGGRGTAPGIGFTDQDFEAGLRAKAAASAEKGRQIAGLAGISLPTDQLGAMGVVVGSVTEGLRGAASVLTNFVAAVPGASELSLFGEAIAASFTPLGLLGTAAVLAADGLSRTKNAAETQAAFDAALQEAAQPLESFVYQMRALAQPLGAIFTLFNSFVGARLEGIPELIWSAANGTAIALTWVSLQLSRFTEWLATLSEKAGVKLFGGSASARSDRQKLEEQLATLTDATFQSAIAAGDAAASLTDLAEKSSDTAQQLRNLPEGFKIAGAIFEAMQGVQQPGMQMGGAVSQLNPGQLWAATDQAGVQNTRHLQGVGHFPGRYAYGAT